MRFLEIRTQRIFSNIIKQNQKLGSDSLLKQTMTLSSLQSPVTKVQRPGSRVHGAEFRSQDPESSVQSPASNTCVQSPGIPVCQFCNTSVILFSETLHAPCHPSQPLLQKSFANSIFTYCRCVRCEVMISNNQQTIIL